MSAMVCTRPDMAHTVGVVSRYMNNPGKEKLQAVKWILKYLRGTTTKALCFGGSNIVLQGYVDSDMAGNIDSRRSTIGYVFTLGGTTVRFRNCKRLFPFQQLKQIMLLLQRLVKR